MPLNLNLTLRQRIGGWDNAIEIATPGYSLFHPRASYHWSRLRLDFGIENLFDRFYALPLGGAYLGQGRTMALNPTDGTLAWGTAVPGMGRSYYVGLNLSF